VFDHDGHFDHLMELVRSWEQAKLLPPLSAGILHMSGHTSTQLSHSSLNDYFTFFIFTRAV
jgi:hypothetical protein